MPSQGRLKYRVNRLKTGISPPQLVEDPKHVANGEIFNRKNSKV